MLRQVSYLLAARKRIGQPVSLQVGEGGGGGMVMGILQGAGLGCLELQDADGDTVYLPLETVAAMAFGPSVSRRFQLLQEETRLQTLERERKFGERHRRRSAGESEGQLPPDFIQSFMAGEGLDV